MIFQSLNSSIYLFATLYFWFLDKDTENFAFVGYILQITSVLLICFIPESPVVLIEQNRMNEGQKSIERIAWLGGKQYDQRSSKLYEEIRRDQARARRESLVRR